MKYKYNYRKQVKETNKKTVIIISIIIFVSIIFSLFLFRNNPLVSKVNNIITYPIKLIANSNLINSVSDGFKTNSQLKEENSSLKEEYNKLSLKLLEYEKLQRENESLRKQLDIKTAFVHYNIKTSNIIIRSHDSYNEFFEIDIGSQDGVKKGQAVVHINGLVGYVSDVTENTSKVVTILDPKASVSVTLQALNSPALLTGSMELKMQNYLRLESIEIGAEVSIGDVIYTSGLGNMYPAYIPVAKIYSVENKKTESERYAICTPIVDISKINEVAVIVGEN